MRNSLRIYKLVFLLFLLSFKNVCVAEGSDIRLQVPYYSQLNYPQQLGTNPPGSKYTISNYGCVITCISMVINAYFPGSTDPFRLNEWLVTEKGFKNDGEYNWGTVKRFPGVGIQEDLKDGRDMSSIDSHLLSGHPVMVRLSNEPIEGWQEHYVLITGKEGNTYYINDPSQEHKTLDYYRDRNKPITRMVFYKGPRPLGSPVVDQVQVQSIISNVAMSPQSGKVGTTFINSGNGFTPNNTVTIMGRTPDGNVKGVVRVRTDLKGSFSVKWTAKTPCNNFAWWAVDDATGKKSQNEVTYNVLPPASTVEQERQRVAVDERKRLEEEKNKELETRYVGIVTRAYKDILKRGPDPGGLQYHVNQMKNGVNEQQLRQVFLSSPEYKERFVYPDTVRKLYTNILKQQPNQDRITYYVDRMKGGWSEQQVRDDLEKKYKTAIEDQKIKEELQQETEEARKTEGERLKARLEFYEGRIRSVETRLLNVIPNPPNINFRLVESKEVGAWANGRITTGMMEFLYSDSAVSPDDQLAMVLAHEIAHVQLKYDMLMKMLDNELKNAKEPLWVKLIGVVDSQIVEKIFNSLINSLIDDLKKDFSRDQESAADFFGLLFVRRAGFNVQEAIKFFERQKENSIYYAYLRDHIETHPSMRTRYETLVKRAEEIANAEIEKRCKAEEERKRLELEKNKELEARYVGIVTRAYKDILKRAPDQDGLQYHVNQMKNGMNELQLRQVFLSSQEYKERFVYPDTVRKLYTNILKQQPNQDRLTYYVERMKGGWSEQQVRSDLERIRNDAVAAQETKREDQLKMELAEKQEDLKRKAEQIREAERQTTEQKESAGRLAEQNRLELEKKKELEARYVGIVTRTYKNILKREPDPGGLQYHVNQMKNGMNELQLRQVFLSSQEYKERFVYPDTVRKLYTNILKQQPDQDRLTYYVERMKGGWSEQQVRGDIEGLRNTAIAEQERKRLELELEKKKELETRYVGIVTRAYKDILKRDPDQGGLQTYVDLMKKGWSEQKVRNTLLGSQEYKQMIAKQALQKQKSIQVGSTVTVANTGGIGLLLRSSPGLKYPTITNLPDGTRMKVMGGPVQADGYIWWRLQGNPGTGWSVGNWLVP